MTDSSSIRDRSALAPLRAGARGRLCALALLVSACHSKGPPPAAVEGTAAPAAPDRLSQGERLPESETAFGLSLPPGMKLTRRFNDSAYFLGRLDLPSVLIHLKSRLSSGTPEMLGGRAVFARTQIKSDAAERWVRVEVYSQGNGTALFIQDLTPPQMPRLSESQMWSRVGRNPDGTPKDENQQY